MNDELITREERAYDRLLEQHYALKGELADEQAVSAALRAELAAARAAIANIEELVRVGAQIHKGGNSQEWTIWSNYADKVRLTTDFFKGMPLPPTEEGFETVLDAAAEALKRWRAEYIPT